MLVKRPLRCRKRTWTHRLFMANSFLVILLNTSGPKGNVFFIIIIIIIVVNIIQFPRTAAARYFLPIIVDSRREIKYCFIITYSRKIKNTFLDEHSGPESGVRVSLGNRSKDSEKKTIRKQCEVLWIIV